MNYSDACNWRPQPLRPERLAESSMMVLVDPVAVQIGRVNALSQFSI